MASESSIGIIGSGWLGLPLAGAIQKQFHPEQLLLSYRSESTREQIVSANFKAGHLDIDDLSQADSGFFGVDTLIINIPSKSLIGFEALVSRIQVSKVTRILFVSSTSVYNPSPDLVTEETLTNDSPLAQIERHLITCGKPLTIIRPGGLIGGNRHPGRFFKRTGLIPNPDLPVNLIHRDDVIGAILMLLGKEQGCPVEIVNLVASSHPSRGELYLKASQSVGNELICDEHSDKQSYKCISNEKLTNELGYRMIFPDLLKLLEVSDAFTP